MACCMFRNKFVFGCTIKIVVLSFEAAIAIYKKCGNISLINTHEAQP